MADPRIRKLIGAQQERLLAEVSAARAKSRNPSSIGNDFEASFRDFLRAHLPLGLSVAQGEVIDESGATSKQTDVLILEDEHPFRLDSGRPGLALIEGVAAAGELKTNLTGPSLASTIAASKVFKKLRAQEAGKLEITANQSDVSRFYDHRPYFLIAAESQLSLGTVAEKLREADEETHGQILDAVYLLDRGWIANFADGTGALRMQSDDGRSHGGWQVAEIPAGEVLFDFFVWLSVVMPRIIRTSSPFLKYL